jgi:hypothetical protein
VRGKRASAALGRSLTQDEVLRSCERSDRILRAVLGETPERTASWFAPLLALLLLAAGIASLIG